MTKCLVLGELANKVFK